ncbi:Leucine rich repeat / protein phosphatase 2C domain containing protein [Entamoeba marina]
MKTFSLQQFPQLTHLRIYSGKIQKIFELPPIETLFIENVELESIESIPDCKELSLQSNKLTSLPNLNSRIETLNLKNNYLTKIPNHFTKIKKLDLTNNLCTSIPFLQTSLHFVSIAYNELTEFPKTITTLQHLKYLDLSKNKIVTIPKKIKYLTNLQQLRLSCNYICYLPKEISENRLYQIPQHLPISLKTLLISSNHITAIPDVLTTLTLNEIDISCNQIISLGCLTCIDSLKEINCSYNHIKRVPKEIFLLKQLLRFNVTGKYCTRCPRIKKKIMVVATLKKDRSIMTVPFQSFDDIPKKGNDSSKQLLKKQRDIIFALSEWKGNRENMEDFSCFIRNFVDNGTHLALLCDGHGGYESAYYCCLKFKLYLRHILEEKSPINYRNALTQVFLQINRVCNSFIIKIILICCRISLIKVLKDGTTCLCLLLTPTAYYVANTGDCKCLLIGNNYCSSLTTEHRPTNPDEYCRIREKGGFVVNDRTNGVLALSRTIGDSLFQQYMSATPDVCKYEKNSNDCFIVLVCDGISDVLNDNEIYDIVINHYHYHPSRIASAIKDFALCKGSTDNVSCVVCKFL